MLTTLELLRSIVILLRVVATTKSYWRGRVAIGDFVNAVKEFGPGIYIVGLDVHVGFVVNTGDEVYFIHSSLLKFVVFMTTTDTECFGKVTTKLRALRSVLVLIETASGL